MSSYVTGRLPIPRFLLRLLKNLASGRNRGQSGDLSQPGPATPLYTSAAISPVSRADRVRQILSSRGLTLYQVSQRSAEMFGGSSAHYIPHHFYSDLLFPSRSPSIHQFEALSRISNYRLCDWLAVFGFHLDNIPRLQPLLPRKRTVVLDSSVYDENAWIPWFVEKLPPDLIPQIAPLGSFLHPGPPRRARTLGSLGRRAFLYAKLGDDDLLAFPDLMPGSMVRVDTRRNTERLPDAAAGPSGQIFLVEHDLVLGCGRLQRSSKGRIVLCSLKFPFARIELNSDPAFRIYGVVDGEMRPLAGPSVSCRAPSFANRHSHRELRRSPIRAAALGELVRLSRMRAGFSFREASALSRQIAEALADESYSTAIGTLSEYETLVHAPRHVQKIIAICILYGIGFWDFLAASGITVGPKAGEPMPDELIPRIVPGPVLSIDGADSESGFEEKAEFLRTVAAEWPDIPLFAKDGFGFSAGPKDLSLADIFWVGGDRNPIHPYLVRAMFVVVNRRIKKPIETAAKTLWEQPLYMVLKRDGGFLCGACTLQDGLLSLHPYPHRLSVPQRLRNGIDAEVIGQVTAVVRGL
jgi:hypothetical protein